MNNNNNNSSSSSSNSDSNTAGERFTAAFRAASRCELLSCFNEKPKTEVSIGLS